MGQAMGSRTTLPPVTCNNMAGQGRVCDTDGMMAHYKRKDENNMLGSDGDRQNLEGGNLVSPAVLFIDKEHGTRHAHHDATAKL